MIKLVDLLKEVLLEAKQVGDLYHFTPLSNLKTILLTKYLTPNGENQISTSVRANMDTSGLHKMDKNHIVRLMLDGDKISNKYKVRPFAFDNEDLGEEQIVVDSKNFYFMPYLKRIDVFLDKKSKIKINNIIELLKDLNIPYKIYEGTPQSHIPYKQPKNEDPSNIKDINILPKYKEYTEEDMYFPGMKTKKIKIYENKYDIESNNPSEITVGISPEYSDYYINVGFMSNKKYYNYFNLKGKKINIKVIPLPMYDDLEWRKKWKNVFSLAVYKTNIFRLNDTRDAYILIPKKEVDL